MELNEVKHYRSEAGTYIGASNVPIDGGIECTPPEDARQIYDFPAGKWGAVPAELPDAAVINAERDRRIAAGFSFNGVHYDFDARAKANISGAAQLAFMAVVAGAEAGVLFWIGGDEPFMWIAADNTLVTMDAQTVVEFGRAAAQHEQAHIFAARALKDMDPIPLDFADDGYWP